MTSFEGFLSIFRQVNPKNYKLVKEQTNNILASFPKEQDRLFLRYSSDSRKIWWKRFIRQG